MNLRNKIIIYNDFELMQEKLIEEYGQKNLRFFIPKNPDLELRLNDLTYDKNAQATARAIMKESYMAEAHAKIIVILAKSFREEAQNFLLKLFEEPPKNVYFIIVAPSKNVFLPTILSRFMIEKHKIQREKISLNLDLKKMDLANVLAFLKKYENIDKQECLELISALSYECFKQDIKLNDEEIDFFYKAYELAKLNAKPSVLLSTIVLFLHERKQ
ncbi:DNA polymerase III, delta prime subunit [Campylobacter subantarcticus LMG 24377]|uniref:DNA polymerase III subunit delta n=2 Tax=Campylobacteraceae TaxID=72294 RepID=A0ABW9N5S2_9BACT|nr:DNA polymerase III subunit delta' [Campylobacter subantarcticus]AJC92327.1 DNA polymerase III, delta prime subunit [Campylobacter subantarcticus LMG 24377]EAL3938550.1 DNA polymerase III subunit delta' [Campylobacter lari]MPB99615.1 DNA polymerase III subunit delta' [Campylobacter subantarcticus]